MHRDLLKYMSQANAGLRITVIVALLLLMLDIGDRNSRIIFTPNVTKKYIYVTASEKSLTFFFFFL